MNLNTSAGPVAVGDFIQIDMGRFGANRAGTVEGFEEYGKIDTDVVHFTPTAGGSFWCYADQITSIN